MSIHKVIEVLASSKKSWEDAAQAAVSEAAKTINHIESIYIMDHSASVEKDKIVEYRINAKITFKIEKQ